MNDRAACCGVCLIPRKREKSSRRARRSQKMLIMPSPLANVFMKAVILSPLHPLMGDAFAMLAVTGRKTGRRISTPVNVTLQDGEYLVISLRNRMWWRNLLDGRAGELHHRGKTFPVTARILDQAPKVLPVLKSFFEAYPCREKYFGIRTDPGGHALEHDLTRAAEERVAVFLAPRGSG
jgi:deazaflavin-dependent oxidoreductase (nitroreductase family)